MMSKEYPRPKEPHKQRYRRCSVFLLSPNPPHYGLESKEEWREDQAGRTVGARL